MYLKEGTSMLKKLTLLALAVGAVVAFAAPAAASAHQLTDGAGNTLAVPTNLSIESGNAVSHLAGGHTLTCERVTVTGTLTTNNGSTVTVAMTNDTVFGESGTAENCLLDGQVPVTITATFEHLHLETGVGATNTATFTFIAHIPNGMGGTVTCKYHSTVNVTPESGTSNASASGGLELVEGEGCAPGETFSGEFTVETTAGGPVIID
jgi:hypothetical protein